jgi:hypothetical protein
MTRDEGEFCAMREKFHLMRLRHRQGQPGQPPPHPCPLHGRRPPRPGQSRPGPHRAAAPCTRAGRRLAPNRSTTLGLSPWRWPENQQPWRSGEGAWELGASAAAREPARERSERARFGLSPGSGVGSLRSRMNDDRAQWGCHARVICSANEPRAGHGDDLGVVSLLLIFLPNQQFC